MQPSYHRTKSLYRDLLMSSSTAPFQRIQLSDQPGSAGNVDVTRDAIDEAWDVISQYQLESTPTFPALDPIPIHPCGMHVIEEIDLGSTWDPNHPQTMDLKWIFALQEKSPAVSTAAVEEPYEPLAVSSHGGGGSVGDASQSSSSSTTLKNEAALDVKSERWEERFQELGLFREEFGHCLVPHNWARNRGLAQWVKRQRYQFKLKSQGLHSTLRDDRRQALQDIGFVWSSHHALWEEKLRELQEFAAKYGHCNVPSKYPQNHQLSIWVRGQRRQYKLLGRFQRGKPVGHLTEERYRKLRSLGFEFNPRQVKC
jgi:Helicase associated domain